MLTMISPVPGPEKLKSESTICSLAIDDTLPSDLPVQNGDRVDAILFERRCDI
jgi:hypothetical protein